MKLNVFKGLVFATLLLVIGVGSTMAQDTAYVEVRFQDPDVWAHDQSASSSFDVYVYSTKAIKGMSLGFAMNRRIVHIDTAYLSPAMAAAALPTMVFVNDSLFSSTGKTLSYALFGPVNFFSMLFDAGDTTFIGTCEFSFKEDSLALWADDSVLFWFDSTKIPPAGDFILTDNASGATILPSIFVADSTWLKRFVKVSEIRPNVVPKNFELSQNYPNPFNPTTNIEFAVPAKSHVELVIYNALGQRVRELINEDLDAGWKSVTWDGTDNSGNTVASGIYLYRIEAGDFAQSKKMILMK